MQLYLLKKKLRLKKLKTELSKKSTKQSHADLLKMNTGGASIKPKTKIRDFLRKKFKKEHKVINLGKDGPLPGGIFIQLKKANLFSTGGDTMLKKIPEGPKGEGLRKLKAERPDVTKKNGFC